MKKTMRILSLLMVLVLCVSLASLSAFAEEEPEEILSGEDALAPIVEDDAPDIMDPVEVESEPEEVEEAAEVEETETVEETAEVEETETVEVPAEVEEAEEAEDPEKAPAEDGGASGDFTYTSEGDNATVTAYTGSASILTIPAQLNDYTVTGIGSEAFKNCTGLTSVTIPEGVTSIGEDAFYGCTNLTDISYGGTQEQWGAVSIGSGNSQLTSVAIHCTDGDVVPGTSGDYAYTLGDNKVTITDYTGSAANLTIPAQIDGYPVTKIGARAFFLCHMTSVTIPESVTSIGSEAFYLCSSLTSVTIPEGVTSIGYRAFYGCSSLTSVTIPEGVTSIGRWAFYNCSSLTSVTIPASVTSIGSYAFDDYDKLKDVYYNGTLEQWGTVSGSSGDGLTLVSIHCTDGGIRLVNGDYVYKLSSNSVTITDYTGTRSTLTIPAQMDGYSVTSIGDSAFAECSSLTSVTIPEGVTSIGRWAFYNCNSLTSVTIPVSVTSIGDYAFEYCGSLTSVTIPSSVTSIGRCVFSGCSSLADIYYGSMEERWKEIGGSSSGYSANSTNIHYGAYTVTYNANSGENAPDAMIKTNGEDLTLSSEVPTREGYTFLGWSATKTAATADYAAGGTYAADAKVTLYAVWKVNTYTVMFDANGGENAPAAQTKTYGRTLTLTSDVPTREGYTFQGWATTNTAETATYRAGGSYTANVEITFYAVWKLNTYTVTYNANGGENAPDAMTKTHGEDLTLSSEVPTREGYTFLGWAVAINAATADYAAGSTYAEDAKVTLYAVWEHTGDVNGSGVPDSSDLVALAKYLSGDNSEAKSPDVNNDGVYDLLDLVRLMKLLAK